MPEIGTISINLDGASYEQTERCRQIIHLMFERGIFNIRNGSAELHFDHNGILQTIKSHVESYRRNKDEPVLTKLHEHVTVQLTESSIQSNRAVFSE